MSIRRVLFSLALGALTAATISPARAADTGAPEELAPFGDLARKCADFEKKSHPLQWGVLWSENFDAAASDRWIPKADDPLNPPMNAANGVPKMSAETIDKRECAILDASQMQGGYLRVGPEIRGDFAIEYVGQAMSDRVCDLSILCTNFTSGPCFQFGAHYNTDNELWYWTDAPTPQRMVLGNTPLVEKGRWYTVRMEVVNGIVRGLIDGKVYGQAKSTPQPGRMYRTTLYCYESKIAVDSIKIESMVNLQKNVDVDAVFREVFKDQTRDQVNQQLTKLVERLEDKKFPVREEAGKMLRSIGSLAEPMLRDAAESGLPESSGRATDILKDITIPKGEDSKPTTAPAVPAAAPVPTPAIAVPY